MIAEYSSSYSMIVLWQCHGLPKARLGHSWNCLEQFPSTRLPTPEATHLSLPQSLPTNRTKDFPNRHLISPSSNNQKHRKTISILFSPNTLVLFGPDFLETRQHSSPSPIKIVPMLVTTEDTSSSWNCLKSSILFSGKITKSLRSKLSKHVDLSSNDHSKHYIPQILMNATCKKQTLERKWSNHTSTIFILSVLILPVQLQRKQTKKQNPFQGLVSFVSKSITNGMHLNLIYWWHVLEWGQNAFFRMLNHFVHFPYQSISSTHMSV